jgi:chromosome partitioning protein
MSYPKIYCYVGNRLTQGNLATTKAFKSVVNEIGKEIFAVWNSNKNIFAIHPAGQPAPQTTSRFRRMFQAEINDANTASVVSSALGIPISKLSPGTKRFLGKDVVVNQTQINKQQPNLSQFAQTIE